MQAAGLDMTPGSTSERPIRDLATDGARRLEAWLSLLKLARYRVRPATVLAPFAPIEFSTRRLFQVIGWLKGAGASSDSGSPTNSPARQAQGNQ